MILAIVAGVVWFSSRGPGEPTEIANQGPQIRSLAVLPMRNLSGDQEHDYLVDGMTEALITDLSRIVELQVTSRSSAMRYKGTDKPLSEIARELNVEALVEGSVVREGDRVAVTAQLIEAATETILWAERYEREISSILVLQGEVAQAIAREIQVTLTPQEEALLASSREVDPEAYEAYLKGMAQFYELTPAGLEAAQHYFERTLEKDPDYAHYLMITGRPEEAIEQMERALELDPYNLLVQALNGMVLEFADRCEEALDFYRNILEAVPNHPIPLGGMVRANYCLGRYEETYQAAVANWADTGRPDAVAALESGYAEGGFKGAMSALAEWKLETAPYERINTTAAFNFAAAGKNQEALDILERGFEEHDSGMPYIGVSVHHITLRDEPRFKSSCAG